MHFPATVRVTMSISPPPSPRYHVAQLPVRRFTVDEYHWLIDENLFVADEQFELIDGYITEKISRNPPHGAAVNRARRRIERAFPSGWIVRIQSAITTADSEPEPDIAIARGRGRGLCGSPSRAGRPGAGC